jgi:tetratricopeptide (TPR) repeat protein
MFPRCPRLAILTALILLAVPLCWPDIARADEKADLLAAFNQGKALEQKADYPGAAKAYQRALDLAPRVFGPQHLDTATILNKLAEMFSRMGQYAEAEPLYQRGLKIRESKLGPNHPEVAESLNLLALVYKEMGQYAQAEPLYQRSLQIRESKLGPDHLDVAASLNNLAEL